MEFKLNQLMKEVPSEWLLKTFGTFYLPTEEVFEEPRIVVPSVGRFYDMDLFVCDEEIIPYKELLKKRPEVGKPVPYEQYAEANRIFQSRRVYLYESWVSSGDDGHTYYKMVGWMLVQGTLKNPSQELDDMVWDYYKTLKDGE